MAFPVWHPDKEISDDTECKRSWYNKYVKKLPVPDRDFTNVGSELHACVERYLESGDLEEGEPFPDGWDKKLKKEEAELVKNLVTQGIEEGFIQKEPQRVIELPLWDGKDHLSTLQNLKPTWSGDFLESQSKACWEIAPGILITGYIDLWHSGNKIKDWKTSSNPHKYGLSVDKESTKYVGHDIQLLLYALFLRKVKGVKGHIEVSHTYFPTKNSTKIKEVKCKIAPNVLEKFHKWLTDKVIPAFLELKAMTEPEVKELPHGESACDRYGGCPYKKLCAGTLGEREYKIINNINKGVSKMAEKKKSLADILKEKKAAGKKEEPTPTPTPEVKKEEPTPTPKEAPQETDTVGYTLIIGASVRSTSNQFTTLTKFFNEVTSGMVKEMDVDDWWSLDAFDRKELFQKGKEEILKMANGKTIVCRFLEPDLKALLNVIYDDATTVIEGGL